MFIFVAPPYITDLSINIYKYEEAEDKFDEYLADIASNLINLKRISVGMMFYDVTSQIIKHIINHITNHINHIINHIKHIINHIIFSHRKNELWITNIIEISREQIFGVISRRKSITGFSVSHHKSYYVS